MKIANQRELPCSQAQAWAALNDDATLQSCIPGCESLERLAPEQLQLAVMAAVGPVRARFKAKLQLQDLCPPESYAVQFEGQGGIAGFAKGRAEVRLTPLTAQSCRLDYSADVQIGGKLAQVGSRVVDAAAQKIIVDFFARFEAKLDGAQHETAPTADALGEQAEGPQPTWFGRLLTWLGGLFVRRHA